MPSRRGSQSPAGLRLAEDGARGGVQRRRRERYGRLRRQAATPAGRLRRRALLLQRRPRLARQQDAVHGEQRSGKLHQHGQLGDGPGEHHAVCLAPGRACGGVALAAGAHDLRAPAEPARGDGLLEKGALLGDRVEEGDADARHGDGQWDARDAGAGAEVQPCALLAFAQLRDGQQGEGVADERVDHGDRIGEPGHVGATPAEQQPDEGGERIGLGLVQAVRRPYPLERRPRPEVLVQFGRLPGFTRRSPREARRRAGRRRPGVVCQEHIQRTTPASSSQT